MKTSTLYELLKYRYATKIINEVQKSDEQNLVKEYESSRRELTDVLDESQKNLLKHCLLSLEDKMNYETYLTNISFLNIGIKLGMEFQRAFTEDEEQLLL